VNYNKTGQREYATRDWDDDFVKQAKPPDSIHPVETVEKVGESSTKPQGSIG
jgi:hypothetical protein